MKNLVRTSPSAKATDGKGGMKMPHWFKKQLRKAYFRKDRYQIRMLNQCWFFYTEKHYL